MSASMPGIEIADPKAYQNKLRSLVGERDPIDVLASTADVLANIIARAGAAILRRRPFAGKWTPNEVLGHLVDAEVVFAWRLRTILCDPRPPITPMDQDRWVAIQGHNDREPADLLSEFRRLREMNLRLWRSLSPEQLQRVGIHAERGEESLELLRFMAAGHDLSHIDQITRYLNAAEGNR